MQPENTHVAEVIFAVGFDELSRAVGATSDHSSVRRASKECVHGFWKRPKKNLVWLRIP
jgi:hypothetical protein